MEEPLMAPDFRDASGDDFESLRELTDLLDSLFPDAAPESSDLERAAAHTLAARRILGRLYAEQQEIELDPGRRVEALEARVREAWEQFQPLPLFQDWEPLPRALALSVLLYRELRKL